MPDAAVGRRFATGPPVRPGGLAASGQDGYLEIIVQMTGGTVRPMISYLSHTVGAAPPVRPGSESSQASVGVRAPR